LRRSSSRSALPFSLGIGVLLLNPYYCIALFMQRSIVDIARIGELMSKYADRPMDLADAALVRVAEREGIRRIFTVDRSDCRVYRLHGRIGLEILP
jgi:uncharacterized protein